MVTDPQDFHMVKEGPSATGQVDGGDRAPGVHLGPRGVTWESPPSLSPSFITGSSSSLGDCEGLETRDGKGLAQPGRGS